MYTDAAWPLAAPFIEVRNSFGSGDFCVLLRVRDVDKLNIQLARNGQDQTTHITAGLRQLARTKGFHGRGNQTNQQPYRRKVDVVDFCD